MKSISIQQKQNNNNWPRDLQKITNNLNESYQSVIRMLPDAAYQESWDNDADVIAKIRKSFDGKWQENSINESALIKFQPNSLVRLSVENAGDAVKWTRQVFMVTRVQFGDAHNSAHQDYIARYMVKPIRDDNALYKWDGSKESLPQLQQKAKEAELEHSGLNRNQLIDRL